MAEDERDAILSRKEMVSGENMQLIVEAEHIRFAQARLLIKGQLNLLIAKWVCYTVAKFMQPHLLYLTVLSI